MSSLPPDLEAAIASESPELKGLIKHWWDPLRPNEKKWREESGLLLSCTDPLDVIPGQRGQMLYSFVAGPSYKLMQLGRAGYSCRTEGGSSVVRLSNLYALDGSPKTPLQYQQFREMQTYIAMCTGKSILRFAVKDLQGSVRTVMGEYVVRPVPTPADVAETFRKSIEEFAAPSAQDACEQWAAMVDSIFGSAYQSGGDVGVAKYLQNGMQLLFLDLSGSMPPHDVPKNNPVNGIKGGQWLAPGVVPPKNYKGGLSGLPTDVPKNMDDVYDSIYKLFGWEKNNPNKKPKPNA